MTAAIAIATPMRPTTLPKRAPHLAHHLVEGDLGREQPDQDRRYDQGHEGVDLPTNDQQENGDNGDEQNQQWMHGGPHIIQ